MVTERAMTFLQSKNVPSMYQLTREELWYVAEKVNVRINATKKEDMQMELKNALVENEWFREDTDDDGEGEQEKEDMDKA